MCERPEQILEQSCIVIRKDFAQWVFLNVTEFTHAPISISITLHKTQSVSIRHESLIRCEGISQLSASENIISSIRS